jgi:hypothetical protein
MKNIITGFAFLGVLLACENTPTFPTTPPTTTSVPVELPPPRVDQPFSWDNFNGFTAFALGHPGQDDKDVQDLFAIAMSYGWNTARVCAETEFWDGNPVYLVRKPRDPERLDWLLDTIARIPGAQVLLIGDCTLKGPVPEVSKREWARSVATIASQYQNVAIETHNEFDNCRGRGWGPHCPGKQDVAEHIRIYRSAGIQYVTADDSLGPRVDGDDESKTFSFRLKNIGAAPADFHPTREKGNAPWDPDIKYLWKLSVYNGLYVLSETVAWSDVSGVCDGLRTCDQNRIQSFVDRCAQIPECRFVFHSEALLGGDPAGWWPQAR